MSDASAKPRFLIRLSDGSDLPVASVDDLADHIVSGTVLPDTSLFDTSTGAWGLARDSVVLRFLLEEMRVQGSEFPDVWDRPEEGAPSGDVRTDSGVRTSPEKGRHSESELLDLEFTFTEMPDPIDPDPADDVVMPTTHVADDQPDDEDPSFSPLEPGGLLSSSMSDVIPEDDTAAPASARPPASSSPADERTVADESGVGSAPPDESSPARARKGPNRPYRPAAASRRSGRRVVVATAAALGLIVAGLVFARVWGGGGAGDGADSSTAGDGSQLASGLEDSGRPSFPEPPPDLEEAVRLSEVRFGDRMETTVDSLRAALGLMDGPPDPWLGGYYLANAGDFAEIREFWVSYGLAIEELRLLDRAHFLAMAGSEAREYVSGEDQGDRLEEYLVGRYEAAAPVKEERYRRLVQVSVRAVALHDFLVDYEQELRYTPAVGSAVPSDPVLEVAADDPIVRQGLVAQLDALFAELDGARGGGPPALGGIPAEIFSGFETF